MYAYMYMYITHLHVHVYGSTERSGTGKGIGQNVGQCRVPCPLQRTVLFLLTLRNNKHTAKSRPPSNADHNPWLVTLASTRHS